MALLNKIIAKLKYFFETLDRHRDEVLFVFIKPYWPRVVTPNHLTYLRIVIALTLIAALFYYGNDDGLLIISLFFVGILTDLLDGSVARGLRKVTKIGAMLDPIADRIIILPIAIYSLFPEHRWLLLLIIVLEIINSLISVWAYAKSYFVQSNIFGKVKMLLQSVVFLAILYVWPKAPNLFFISILWISAVFMVVSIYVKYLDIKKLLKHG